MGLFSKTKPVTKRMDDTLVSPEIQKLENELLSRVIGQERAVKQFVRIHETYLSGLRPTTKPMQVLLFVGPTGSGKTHVAEVFAELMNVTLIKVDCGEFQQSHEVAKLLGSPPGYVGAETKPKINKSVVEAKWGKGGPEYTIILFDEIEKADPDFHQLLLGIMDRGILTTGKNETVDLTKTIVIMTSNLGSREVKKLLKDHGGYGFGTASEKDDTILDEDIYHASKGAVSRFFSPEFFNRIDRMIVFRTLNEESLRKVLESELKLVQDRVLKANKFVGVEVSDRGKTFLVEEGTSKEFGARELKRTIERFLVSKITRALVTGQVKNGDIVMADKEPGSNEMVLDIIKAVLEIPKPKTEAFTVRQPARVTVEPEHPGSRRPYEGVINAGYCARCGWRWYDKHLCFDLLDSGNIL